MVTREDKACVERVRDHLWFGVDEIQTWVDCVEIERMTGLRRLAVGTAMGTRKRQLGEKVQRDVRAGELREGRAVTPLPIPVDPLAESLEVLRSGILGDVAQCPRAKLACSGTVTRRLSAGFVGWLYSSWAWSPTVRTWTKFPAFTRTLMASYPENVDRAVQVT